MVGGSFFTSSQLPKLLGQVFLIGLQVAGKLAIETLKKNLVGGGPAASVSVIRRPASISLEEACKILNVCAGCSPKST